MININTNPSIDMNTFINNITINSKSVTKLTSTQHQYQH